MRVMRSFEERLVDNLRERKIDFRPLFSYSREKAYAILKQETGQDFGYDTKAWLKWLKAHPLHELVIPEDVEEE
jgi:hypothetical protein